MKNKVLGMPEATDYDEYKFSASEAILYYLICFGAGFGILFIFFHNAIISLSSAIISLFLMKAIKKKKIRDRKNKLLLQFKDMLYSVSSSVSAGDSVEKAFIKASQELSFLYPAGNEDIHRELDMINNKLRLNMPIEDAVDDFARRSHLDDVENFADIFKTCKRTSGDIATIMRSSSTIIAEKIETKEEISTLLTEKKVESKLVLVMPVGTILLFSFSSSEYMSVLYSTGPGRIVMLITLGLLCLSYLISEKIMNIEV